MVSFGFNLLNTNEDRLVVKDVGEKIGYSISNICLKRVNSDDTFL